MLMVAIIGWSLFVIAAVWHYIGLRLDARESNALEIFTLCIMLSNDFRAPIKQGYERAILEASSIEPRILLFRLMKGVTLTAKGYDPGQAREPLSVDTFGVALDAIAKIQES